MSRTTFCARHKLEYVTEESCPHCREEETIIARGDRREAESPLHTRKTETIPSPTGYETGDPVDPAAFAGHGQQNPNPMFPGYRELNPLEIAKINLIKENANLIRVLCRGMGDTTMDEVGDAHCYPDRRWLAIAETHFQQGFMALTRAIAKPDSF